MNKYLYEMKKSQVKPRVQELALNVMLMCPDPTPLAEVISFLDKMIEREAGKVDKLAPVPETHSTDPAYRN